MKKLIPFLAVILLGTACQEEQQTYPSIITEMTDAYVNEQGVMHKIETDQGAVYTLTNPQKDFEPQSINRVLSGFVPLSAGTAQLYQMKGVYLLRDSSAIAQKDPTGVLSAWRAGKYINLHLSPKTQGGKQYWGFAVDSVSTGHTRISLHHRQNNDAPAYTQDTYASIPVDSIKTAQPGDSLIMTVATFNGFKTWTFKK